MPRRLVRLAPVLLLPLALAACGGSSQPAADGASAAGAPSASSAPATDAASTAADATPTADAATDSASTEATATDSASAPATGAAPAGLTKIPVNKQIVDPVMGDKVTVVALVRNFPIPAKFSAIQDREIVLVDIKGTAGTKFYSGIQGSGFSILEPGSTIPDSETSIVADEMAKAGFTPLPNDEIDTGKTGEGWLAFTVVKKGATGLSFRMLRLAAGVVGSSQTIPRKEFVVPLPDAS